MQNMAYQITPNYSAHITLSGKSALQLAALSIKSNRPMKHIVLEALKLYRKGVITR